VDGILSCCNPEDIHWLGTVIRDARSLPVWLDGQRTQKVSARQTKSFEQIMLETDSSFRVLKNGAD
jgi:hypothetical protein